MRHLRRLHRQGGRRPSRVSRRAFASLIAGRIGAGVGSRALPNWNAAMPLLSLSDDELDVLVNLAQPLDPQMRDPFLRACAIELGRHRPEALGPGLVSRVGRELQRQFMTTAAIGPVARSRAYH
jgi:hypothetical protein